MRLRVGIDLVLVDSIREALDLHGDRYLERIAHRVLVQRDWAEDRLVAAGDQST